MAEHQSEIKKGDRTTTLTEAQIKRKRQGIPPTKNTQKTAARSQGTSRQGRTTQQREAPRDADATASLTQNAAPGGSQKHHVTTPPGAITNTGEIGNYGTSWTKDTKKETYTIGGPAPRALLKLGFRQ